MAMSVIPEREPLSRQTDGSRAKQHKPGLLQGMRDFLFGDNGGARYSDLERLSDRNGLSDYLPWKLYDRNGHRYLNVNNTIGYIWECTPLPLSPKRKSRSPCSRPGWCCLALLPSV